MELLEHFENAKYTAKERKSLSFPTKILLEKKKLNKRVLDFGCGYGKDVELLKKSNIDISGYDLYHKPEHPRGKFDTIICNYVLNVVFFEEMVNIIMIISEYLKPNGIAFFTVRRDLKKEGFREHWKYKKITYQKNVVLPFSTFYKNDFCEIYEFQNQSNDNITNAINFYAQFAYSKSNSIVYKIFPKENIEPFHNLSSLLKNELWLIINRVMKIVKHKNPIKCFNLEINSKKNREAATLTFEV